MNFYHLVFTAPSLDLKAAHVPLIAQEVCRRKEYYGEDIMDTMFCAGYLNQASSGITSIAGNEKSLRRGNHVTYPSSVLFVVVLYIQLLNSFH